MEVMGLPASEENASGGDHPEPSDPNDISWTAPDLRDHLPDEEQLSERGLAAAVGMLRNPDAGGRFVAGKLNRSREPDIVREALRDLLAYPLSDREPRDAKSPTAPDYSTGPGRFAGRSANSFADLTPKQRGVVEVAARDEMILQRVDGGESIPAADICRRVETLGFPRPHDSYPRSVLSEHRDIVADRRAVLAARNEVFGDGVLEERLDAAMDPETDTPVRWLLEAAGWYLPDHNLDSLPPADQCSEDDLHPPADEQEAARRALSVKEAAAAGRPVPWDPDTIDTRDKRIGEDGSTTLGDHRPTAVPAPWPLVRSVLAPSGVTNRSVRAGLPYAAVVNNVDPGFGVFVNLDQDCYTVNGLLRAEQLPGDAETDFEPGDRVAVYLRDRSNLDAADARDVDLEFVLAPRTVAERYSPAAAERFAAQHTTILPGEGPDEETPADPPDPDEGLEADPAVMLLDPPEDALAEVDATEHARRQYTSRVRLPEAERPPIETAWSRAESVDPEPFAEVDGDAGAPDAVRYDAGTNVALVRRGDTLRTALHGFGFSHEMVRAVKRLGHDPKPGDDEVSVPTGGRSVVPAVRPVLDHDRQTETATITDSRARDPPGFIDEWPRPDLRPAAGAVATTAVVRRVPRQVSGDRAPAVERVPPTPRTPPAAVAREPAVRPLPARPAERPTPDEPRPDTDLRSFARVREELDRLEAAGHEVAAISFDLDDEGATLSVETEE
jgi:hypothetical protein